MVRKRRIKRVFILKTHVQKACAKGGMPEGRRRGKEPGLRAAQLVQRLGLRGTKAS
jgi:hypothetical protein